MPESLAPSAPPAWASFVAAFERAVADGSLVALVLSKNRTPAADLTRVDLRRIDLRGEVRVQMVFHHATRDVTRNVGLVEASAALRGWLDGRSGDADFGHATLRTRDAELQLLRSRSGSQRIVSAKAAAPAGPAGEGAHEHDRRKHRHVPADAPFLVELGVTDAAHRVVPAMARKYRQIDKFVEIFDSAWTSSPLAAVAATRPVEVVDFGCGRGYLTFAVADHLRRIGVGARVTGVEWRADLVADANRLARRVGLAGLAFVEGDIASHVHREGIDVAIALHACDTATDHALDTGIAAGAGLLVAAPCCHKELRPQLAAPSPLAPLLRHGVHLGQQAEMLTDTLRVLALEASGYDAKVFEFVSLEHTSKNKMILATRRGDAGEAASIEARSTAAASIDALKRFWGIREQRLDRLLSERSAAR